MYVPKPFEVRDPEVILSFIAANAFGQIVSMVEHRLFASHVPFLPGDGGRSLRCHLARANPQWEDIEGQEVLAIFQGAHDYVSPSWYGGPGVPTWNYQAAHVYASARLITAPEKLAELVDGLTKVYESSSGEPWTPRYDPAMLDAIVGIELEVTHVQCKYKLSQNRPRGDRERVAEALEREGSARLGRAMRAALEKTDDGGAAAAAPAGDGGGPRR